MWNLLFFENATPTPYFMALLVLVSVWELVWKAMGLWLSAKNDQKNWFVALLIFNTLGILPILYIKFYKKEKKSKAKKKS